MLAILSILSLRFSYANEEPNSDANEQVNIVENKKAMTLAANYSVMDSSNLTATDLIVEKPSESDFEPRSLIFCGSFLILLSAAAKRRFQKKHLDVQRKPVRGIRFVSLKKAKSSV
jgi:hypothetical protein